MITVSELYRKLDAAIPASLSCEWDNDGLMCCPKPDRACRRVLLALDITERVVDRAIREDFDAILSHHPLVFRPIGSLTTEAPVPRKLIKLVENGIAALSFHTRFDALTGGVNDALAAAIGLKNPVPFGPEGEEMGRIGEIEPCTLADFAETVKKALNAPVVLASGEKTVHRVAILGGSGSDFVSAAKRAGADTYLSGELAYHHMCEARENGLNLVAAGHYHTENIALPALAELVKEADPDIFTEIASANEIQAF
ncbi:MAG: Nif3-like dinuclear metal center hexameric protein [Ruminococcaceae bacterium]|nr:Nif3-like dinuclear metal center hexameric protein [Oscillospiraceae bacterium]